MMFIGEHFFFGPARPAPLLPTNFFSCLLFRGFSPEHLGFNFFNQQPPRPEPVDRLRPVFLALDLKPGGPVKELYAAGCFVHVLSAGTGRTDKRFLDIVLKDTEGFHLFAKGLFFIG
jgi:hypothetical protein